MIAIYAIRTTELPDAYKALELSGYAEAWKARHPNVRNNDTARASLGGLLLLEAAGLAGKLCYTDRGRPFLEGQTVDFNITHTGTYVLCAVDRNADGNLLGLDAEDVNPERGIHCDGMAKRWFSDGEQALFSQEPTQTNFLRIWTRKEAFLKRTGKGLCAIREADTCALGVDREVDFAEYTLDGTLITLCVKKGNVAPRAISVLTKRELYDRLSKKRDR